MVSLEDALMSFVDDKDTEKSLPVSDQSPDEKTTEEDPDVNNTTKSGGVLLKPSSDFLKI